MGKPEKLGAGLATAAAAGTADEVTTGGQAREAVLEAGSKAVGTNSGSTATNAASTPASTGGGDMVTGLPPDVLTIVFLVAVGILFVASKWD